MATCDVCGNEYDKTFNVHTADGKSLVFDSMQCAAQAMAPVCANCGVRILGHGSEADGRMFCCGNCARQAGVAGEALRV